MMKFFDTIQKHLSAMLQVHKVFSCVLAAFLRLVFVIDSRFKLHLRILLFYGANVTCKLTYQSLVSFMNLKYGSHFSFPVPSFPGKCFCVLNSSVLLLVKCDITSVKRFPKTSKHFMHEFKTSVCGL